MAQALRLIVSGWSARFRQDGHLTLPLRRPGHSFRDGSNTSHTFSRAIRRQAWTLHNEFSEWYKNGTIHEPELGEYFFHDRAVHESGHDAAYRLGKHYANLGTINLQLSSLKHGVDNATAICEVFDDGAELDEDFDISSIGVYAHPHRERSRVVCPS